VPTIPLLGSIFDVAMIVDFFSLIVVVLFLTSSLLLLSKKCLKNNLPKAFSFDFFVQ
jgi:hypothetical protein